MADGHPIGAVLTGGDFQALAALRTLAKKNIPVVLLEHEHGIARYSNYKKRVLKSPPVSEHAAYADFLEQIAERESLRGWVIFPNSDEAVYVLARYRDRLKPYYRITTPDWSVIRNVYIKKNTYQLAEANGIPTPQTFYPQSEDELAALPLSYPAVLKPSIRDHYYSKVKTKAYRVDNRDALLRAFRLVTEHIPASEVLVQDLIPGGPSRLYSFCPFFKDGRTVAGVMARRSRQHPMDFGHASTFAEVVRIPEMQELAERFLSLIGYYGICEVEFMHDPRDNRYKLIEVNPRIWGWHALAIAAGVDLPHYVFQDMLGRDPLVQAPDPDAKWSHFTTDFPTVLLEMARGRMTWKRYRDSLKGKLRDAVFAREDPLPFLAELIMIPYLWVKRGF